MKVAFAIPGRLGGKGRARSFMRSNGKMGHCPHKKTAIQEGVVRQFASMAMGERELLCGPLSLGVKIFMSHPASWSKKRKESTYYVTGRPDADNIIKLICDGMNLICFTDDAQIAKVQFERRYVQGTERVEVIVEELPLYLAEARAA